MNKIIFRILFLLSVIVIIGNYLDAITTYFALKKDGTYETNKAMDYVIKKLDGFNIFLLNLY